MTTKLYKWKTKNNQWYGVFDPFGSPTILPFLIPEDRIGNYSLLCLEDNFGCPEIQESYEQEVYWEMYVEFLLVDDRYFKEGKIIHVRRKWVKEMFQ